MPLSLPERGRALLRFPNWLGDCIMAAPVIDALRERLPNWDLEILVRRPFHELFQNDPRVRRVVPFEYPLGGLKRHLQLARILAKGHYDLGLILPDSFSSALNFYLARLPLRIGYAGEGRRFMLRPALPRPSEKIHRSLVYLRLLSSLSDGPISRTFPKIYSDGSAADAADRLLQGTGKFVVLAPYSRALSRRWGLDRFAQLATALQREFSLRIVLLGAGDEERELAEVARLSEASCLNLAGRSGLLTSYEILARAAFFIGNDSGAAHLAAAAGTYTISLSGADDPEETAPLAARGRVIRKALFCSPCVKNVCPRKDFPNECMHLICVEDVLAAAAEALRGS